MKAVILAGGLGTRLSEETSVRPKPMVEIGGKPIIWHIMKYYSSYGINDFIICCGYKSYLIKEYFANYFLHMSDVTFDLSDNEYRVHDSNAEDWRVTLIDTGEYTQTGGRLLRVRDHIGGNDFCFTYGDGLCDVDLADLIQFHQSRDAVATVTAAKKPGRYGALELDRDQSRVERFSEKPLGDGNWINGGFFVLSDRVFDYLSGDDDVWEQDVMPVLAREISCLLLNITVFGNRWIL